MPELATIQVPKEVILNMDSKALLQEALNYLSIKPRKQIDFITAEKRYLKYTLKNKKTYTLEREEILKVLFKLKDNFTIKDVYELTGYYSIAKKTIQNVFKQFIEAKIIYKQGFKKVGKTHAVTYSIYLQ